jgi:hypothetical protein
MLGCQFYTFRTIISVKCYYRHLIDHTRFTLQNLHNSLFFFKKKKEASSALHEIWMKYPGDRNHYQII